MEQQEPANAHYADADYHRFAACADADQRQCRPHSMGHQLAASECGNGSTSKVTPLWQVDDGLVLNLRPAWAPDPDVRKKILVDNPARLYEF
jgi:hypothetical protein